MTSSPITRGKTGFRLSIFGAVLHTTLSSILLLLYVWRVPAVKKMCDEFGLTLPWSTQTIFRISSWLSGNLAVASLILLFMLSIDIAVIFLLGQYRRSAQWLWIMGIGLSLLAVGAVSVVGIELPILKLKEGLSH
jgi:type II secretory pathway component PulF